MLTFPFTIFNYSYSMYNETVACPTTNGEVIGDDSGMFFPLPFHPTPPLP